MVQLPLGVWLPSGATLFPSLEATAGFVAPSTVCRQGCLASTVVTPDRLAELTTAPGPGRLAFVDATGRTGRPAGVLQGLKAALDAHDTNRGGG